MNFSVLSDRSENEKNTLIIVVVMINMILRGNYYYYILTSLKTLTSENIPKLNSFFLYRKLYWISDAPYSICASNLDGTHLVVLMFHTDYILTLALHLKIQ